MAMRETAIAFIGGGNMAQAIIAGLLEAKFKPENLLVCAPTLETRTSLVKKYQLNVAQNNASAVHFAEVIFIAVKPNLIELVCKELNLAMKENTKQPLIINLAAGQTTTQLQQYLQNSQRIITAMPNLPSAVCQGLTGLVPAKHCNEDDIKLADDILSSIGKTVWLDDESKMPALVATAGSAPAYFFLFLEAMIESGKKLGLSHQQAQTSALQSGMGALTMALTSEMSVTELKNKVTSPNGTTQQALDSFSINNLTHIVNDAMQAAAQKAANY